MSGKCTICGKTPSSGYNVSHSKRHTKRTWSPNIQRHTIMVEGAPLRVKICTACLRTLQKARR